MRTIKLTLSYDGTAYWGWQCQPDKPTVQSTLEDAIAKVTGERARTLASGRTDTGVHALGQVASFRTNSSLAPEVVSRALNAHLPNDIAVLNAAEVPNEFHPIRDAVRKRYRYVIYDDAVRDVFGRHYAWHYSYGRLDAEAMHRAALALLGPHDFSSFESSGAERASSVRTISDIFVARGEAGQGRAAGECQATGLPASFGSGAEGDGPLGEGSHVVLEVESNGFLYNMVRAIVGTLVQVGRGSQPENWVGEVLRAKDRSAAGPTAPPQGLFLVRVEYRAESIVPHTPAATCASLTSLPE